MKRETAFIAAVAIAAALPACEYFDKGPTTPAASPSPGTAALSIAVAPDPLKILWVCPIADTYCYGSLDSTVTVTETAGVGGRVDNVDFTVRDALLGIELTTLHLSSEDIKAKVGTNRIEAMGKLAVRPIVEGYPIKKDIPRPSLNIDISVQVTDDKNNVVKTTKRVPVA
ncbi:MAG TPA: hypothetical protein VEQ84_17490 [Vicinamibacteria bacterium]|nr:hypothetical protein [Vicinamibacteria bacterium]